MNESTEVKDVLILNERVFSICDAWPLGKKYKKFIVYLGYLTVHMALMYMDLFGAFGNLEAMVDNIIDNTIATATYFMLLLLRFNRLMERAIVIVKQELAENRFNNVHEKQLYLEYHSISDRFGRYSVNVAGVIGILWFLRPIVQVLQLASGQSNESQPYVLPFRVYAFIDYENDLQNFMIMYLYQIPIVYIAVAHANSVSLLVSMVLHICGKLSILSYRIQNISTKSNVDLDRQIKQFVVAHLRLIVTSNTINSAFQIVLLIERLQTSIRLAVLVYMMLINSQADIVSTLTYSLYISIVTMILYLYSLLGDCLSYESTRVAEAYYNTEWNSLSAHNQKLVLLVMSLGRQTLHVTAGKFYNFSLYGFIDIVKTSFGYVSLLRAVI